LIASKGLRAFKLYTKVGTAEVSEGVDDVLDEVLDEVLTDVDIDVDEVLIDEVADIR